MSGELRGRAGASASARARPPVAAQTQHGVRVRSHTPWALGSIPRRLFRLRPGWGSAWPVWCRGPGFGTHGSSLASAGGSDLRVVVVPGAAHQVGAPTLMVPSQGGRGPNARRL